MICLTGDIHHMSLRTGNQAHCDITEAQVAQRYLKMLEEAKSMSRSSFRANALPRSGTTSDRSATARTLKSVDITGTALSTGSGTKPVTNSSAVTMARPGRSDVTQLRRSKSSTA